MGAKRIDGTIVAREYQQKLTKRIKALNQHGIMPGLCGIVVGESVPARAYMNRARKACEELHIRWSEQSLPEDITQQELLALIEQLNQDSLVHGILIQLPLPRHIEERAVIRAIDPQKDVDGFHPENVGALMEGYAKMVPCTAASVMKLIHATGVPIAGKHAVVVGRSNIVGKPVAMLLLQQNATVTICHSQTQNLAEICYQADILVATVGKLQLITGDMIKPGAIVIDVGMNRDTDGTFRGDVDFAAAEQVAGYLTPVPGGVGPMTIMMLLRNTIRSAQCCLPEYKEAIQ